MVRVCGIQVSEFASRFGHGVDAEVAIDGLVGDVTLVPDHDGDLIPFGASRDQWLSGNLVELGLDDDALADIVSAVRYAVKE